MSHMVDVRAPVAGSTYVVVSGSHRDNTVIRFDEVAGTGEEERVLMVGDDQHRLEPAQEAIRAPVAR